MSHYFINMPEDLGKKYSQFTYPAGETQVRIILSQLNEIRACKQVTVIARITDGNIFPLQLLCNALSSVSDIGSPYSLPLNIILPYLPYSRADRRFVEGDCYALGVFCALVDQLHATRLVTLDIHSRGARLWCGAKLDSVPPTVILKEVIDCLSEKFTVLLPDEGSRYRYDWSSFPQNFPVLNSSKHRDPQTGKLSHFEVPVIETPAVLIVDDICDGGGTFVGIAQKLKEAQPDLKLYLYVSHGIFSKGFLELKKYFGHIYTTDSVYGNNPKAFSEPYDLDFVTIFPVDGILKSSFLNTQELFEQADPYQEARNESSRTSNY